MTSLDESGAMRLRELEALRGRVRALESELAAVSAGATAQPHPSALCVTSFSQHELSRYGRQMIVPGVGAATQAFLRGVRVLIVGAGGLGCPAALYLAGAGVGAITVVDDDNVELSNLHRQIAHSEAYLGRPKAESLCAAVRRLNSTVATTSLVVRLDPRNCAAIVSSCDVVLDCSDNPATRCASPSVVAIL